VHVCVSLFIRFDDVLQRSPLLSFCSIIVFGPPVWCTSGAHKHQLSRTMSDYSAKDHHGDPAFSLAGTKEEALQLLASLLASILEEQTSSEDVRRALNSTADDDDDDAWRVRVAECVHARQSGGVRGSGPSPPTAATSTAAAAAATSDTQEWVCPMCETVNWAPDARKSLRRRHDECGSAASLPSAELHCACCRYGGVVSDDDGGA
jgi:hypothetical protein